MRRTDQKLLEKNAASLKKKTLDQLQRRYGGCMQWATQAHSRPFSMGEQCTEQCHSKENEWGKMNTKTHHILSSARKSHESKQHDSHIIGRTLKIGQLARKKTTGRKR
jgi:hypothetical protein